MPLTQVPASMIATGGIPPFDGIKFPATQSASSDANTLDDYEEGTWTPTLNSFTTTGTLTLTGTYTKVGRLVCLTWRLQSSGGAINAIQGSSVSGVPFTQYYPGSGTSGVGGAGDAGMNQLINNLVYFTKSMSSADYVGSGFYFTN